MKIPHWLAPLALLSLLAAACNSSGSKDPDSASGGTGGKGGSTSTGGTTVVDTWVPPTPVETACSIPADTAEPTKVEFLNKIGCRTDFDALASVPLNTSIPGASSGKVVLDTENGDALYFQNSKLYEIHYEFASTHLSVAAGLSDVGALYAFNSSQYSSPDRRFILGAVTYYAGPQYWALEMAPYDTADAAMITKLFYKIRDNAYFGSSLVFHPTSDNVATAVAGKLPEDIHIKTTDQIFAGIDYQPLNLGECMGRLHFVPAAKMATDFFGFRDIVVIEEVPNDISVTAGIISQQFQTPLSHVNVLAVNRGTPNMGLRKAMTNEQLLALDGKQVHLKVGSSDWTIEEVTQAESDAWWAMNAPTAITLQPVDLTTTDLRDIDKVTDISAGVSLDGIKKAILSFGAKAANYSVMAQTPGIPMRKAFAIPGSYYVKFMTDNGFFAQVDALRADPTFQTDLSVRYQKLADLRAAIMLGKVDDGLQTLLRAKLQAEYSGLSMRFRTSTNAEDLDGFPCAGCYDSHTGDPNVSWNDVLDAIRDAWSGVWFYRTYQEREFHSIDHKTVAMSLLVHHNFPSEMANGVAVTANIYVPSGLDPAFYVNVQIGDNEVVAPAAGVTTDRFLYYFTQPNQPMSMLAHSSLLPAGQASVLTSSQVFELGTVLNKVHSLFSTAYGPGAGNYGWYAMDVEFKFDKEDSTDGKDHLVVKQARPYPGQKVTN